MQGDYLDQRLIGRQFTISATDLSVGATFYGILYHLNATQDLRVGGCRGSDSRGPARLDRPRCDR
ncbi:hypothetical protein [Levilactobacillus namurensis]|uniref:hypothetical protein n=1 Tax=Levilactobacillus namurensis TaxID=380393 RepID=UPI0004B1E30A|nr:hypothetical protein [Levilactobacillus namurensis]